MAKYCIEREGMVLYPECMECKKDGIPYCEHLFLLVVGTRTFDDYKKLKDKLNEIVGNRKDVVIVSGGATGADSLAERYAKENNLKLKVFPAKWNALGKAAGPIRNIQMHEYVSNAKARECICFWDGKSKGTSQSFELARKYKTPLRVIKY